MHPVISKKENEMLKSKNKPVRLKNIRTNEIVICEDYNNIKVIDGVEFVQVHKEGNPRTFLMNKEPLVKIKTETSKKR